MRFLVNKKDFEKLYRNIELKKQRIQNTKSVTKMISTIMYQSVIQNFKEEGTDKEKWHPLSPMTINMRRKGKGVGKAKILQDTGTLKRSIFPYHTDSEAIVSTNIPYASIHQFGGNVRIPERTVYPKKKSVLHFFVDNKEIFAKFVKQPAREVEIPARPFMVLRDEHKQRIIDVLKRYVTGG